MPRPSPTAKTLPVTGAPGATCPQEADALPEAEHVPPSQTEVPVAVMLRSMPSSSLSWVRHACSWVRSLVSTLTNCPLQKSAPSALPQSVVQPPWTIDVQLADPDSWQLMSQLKFACAVQLPVHDAAHWVSQVADGAVPVHEASQCAPQVSWQEAMHWV
jgi:hypothetical protein